VKIRQGACHEARTVAVTVETPRRLGLRQHHNRHATCCTRAARVLGTQNVAQAGSCRPDHLRFDFSARRLGERPRGGAIESLVNEQVQANTPVTHRR